MSPVVACPNCDGRLCMSCVLRQIHDECVEDCPMCCELSTEQRAQIAESERQWALDTGNATLLADRDEARQIADQLGHAMMFSIPGSGRGSIRDTALDRWHRASWRQP